MLETHQKNERTKLIMTVISVVAVAGMIVVINHLKSEESEARTGPTGTSVVSPAGSSNLQSTQASTTGSTSADTSSSAGDTYKNGNYSASSSYFVPRSQETIEVSLTLNNDVVTSVSIKNSEGDHESAQFQREFESAYKTKVVGKKLSGLQLKTVAGASDTTDGFNDALVQIAAQAKV